MGYSFSTPCKSLKARDKMFAFLEKHYHPWGDLAAPFKEDLDKSPTNILPLFSWDTRTRGPLTEGLSYDHGKCKIGFDYGAGLCEGERYWMYNLCYWMAQRVGRRKVLGRKAPGCGAVPYVLYDGFDAWPVLERSEFADKLEDSEWLVDRGFRGMLATVELEKMSFEEDTAGFPTTADLQYIERWFNPRLEMAKRVDVIIRTELARLTSLWDK